MKKEYEIIIKFMDGTLENHPVSPGSTQTMYYDWVFRKGPYKDTINRIASFNVEKRMRFDEDWNLLIPVVDRISEVVEPFTEEGAYRVTLYKHLCDCNIKEVYRYCLHIIKMLNNATTKKSK